MNPDIITINGLNYERKPNSNILKLIEEEDRSETLSDEEVDKLLSIANQD